MASKEIMWRADGRDIAIGLDYMGEGPTLLLLPALSSISTRSEMRPLQERLARSFTTISIDWPGFGDLPKPYVDWRPAIYQQFLGYLLTSVVPQPFGIIAAGHAAGYLFRHLSRHKDASERVILLSPTWRGPLPTMMNGDRAIFPKITRLFDQPYLGGLLYGLNINRFMVGVMARGHVYMDPAWLNRRRMVEKLAVTQTAGARYSSVRFVTGGLDPFRDRREQLQTVSGIDVPILNLFSKNAPRKSRLEMESLSEMKNVKTIRIGKGKLSFYEEFPDEAALEINTFLRTADGNGFNVAR
jgi:pimeloyl-ACP methyl ester carboxylesterase